MRGESLPEHTQTRFSESIPPAASTVLSHPDGFISSTVTGTSMPMFRWVMYPCRDWV